MLFITILSITSPLLYVGVAMGLFGGILLYTGKERKDDSEKEEKDFNTENNDIPPVTK